MPGQRRRTYVEWQELSARYPQIPEQFRFARQRHSRVPDPAQSGRNRGGVSMNFSYAGVASTPKLRRSYITMLMIWEVRLPAPALFLFI